MAIKRPNNISLFVGLTVAVICSGNNLASKALAAMELALHESLQARANIQPNTNTARNIILFIGDGMGVSTVTATRIFDGQSKGGPGEDNTLSFERFPYLALIKTYNTNQQVPDSAGTGTAMHSGVKTRAGVVGVGPEVERKNCQQSLEKRLMTIGELAELRGKATGIVTTTRVTHATPATVYAHSPERDWESNRYLPKAAWQQGCRDIAHQLVHFNYGDGLDVIFGGGRKQLFGSDKGGERLNAEDDLVEVWLAKANKRRYITSSRELDEIKKGEQVLGLFADSHLTYLAERKPDNDEPTLSEMTKRAIKQLATHKFGYFLMIEGGRIDHGHHEGKAGYALSQAQEFAKAVAVAIENTDAEDTLILVTADHSHVFNIAGYPTRGNPILGLVRGNDKHGLPEETPKLAADGQPYTTLGYLNGPGALDVSKSRPRPEEGMFAQQQAVIATQTVIPDGSIIDYETHGGEDVVLYANGPWAHLVGGVLEQNAIFHLMKYAYGWE